MAYPPVLPPSNRANATVQLDNHPSDHNAIAVALAGMGWGRAASVQTVTGGGQSIGAAVTDITGMTVTVQRQAGRLYLALWSITFQQLTAQGTVNIGLTDSANAMVSNPALTVVQSGYGTINGIALLPVAGATAPYTVKLRGLTSAGTITVLINANNPGSLIVVDLGT